MQLSAFRLDDGWEVHLLGHPTDGAIWNALVEAWDDALQVNQQQDQQKEGIREPAPFGCHGA